MPRIAVEDTAGDWLTLNPALGAGRTARVLEVGQACQLMLDSVTPY
jgi:hypothetical protein